MAFGPNVVPSSPLPPRLAARGPGPDAHRNSFPGDHIAKCGVPRKGVCLPGSLASHQPGTLEKKLLGVSLLKEIGECRSTTQCLRRETRTTGSMGFQPKKKKWRPYIRARFRHGGLSHRNSEEPAKYAKLLRCGIRNSADFVDHCV